VKTTGVVRVPRHQHRQKSGLGRDETQHQKLLSKWDHPCCWSRAYGELKQAHEHRKRQSCTRPREPDDANGVQGKSVTSCPPGCAANILLECNRGARRFFLVCVTQRGQNQLAGASSRVAQYKRLKTITKLMVTADPQIGPIRRTRGDTALPTLAPHFCFCFSVMRYTGMYANQLWRCCSWALRTGVSCWTEVYSIFAQSSITCFPRIRTRRPPSAHGQAFR
jgi:hypothetical protein